MILVSGLDYSGTSATAGLLYHLGVDMGDCTPLLLPMLAQEAVHEYGGHYHTWPLYEDRGMTADVAGLELSYGTDLITRRQYTALLQLCLERYTHTGLKTNAACVLTQKLPGTTLILTARDPAERGKRRRYYLGALTTLPHVQRLAAWCEAGYNALVSQADYLVQFATLVSRPEMIVEDLVRCLKLRPSLAQMQYAIGSIQRRA